MTTFSYDEAGTPPPAPPGGGQSFSYEEAHTPPPDQPVDVATVEASKPFLQRVSNFFRGDTGQELGQSAAQAGIEKFKENWDSAPWGMSDEDVKTLQEWGLIRKDKTFEPFKAFNELFLETLMRTGQVIGRGGMAAFQAGQEFVKEAIGGQAGRDIAAIPEAFFGTPHPFGVPKIEAPKPFVKETPIKPIEGAEPLPRARAAKTGDPLVDAVLDDPTVRAVIDNPVVDREHTIPYEAGGSTPLENPTTYVDRHVPQTFTVRRRSDPGATVTFDTAEPLSIHENVEMATMNRLIDGGMTPEEAWRVAHFDFAQMAEHAWYEAHDIDVAAAEEQWKKLLPGIQHEIANEAPPDLYRKPYPGGNVTEARHETLFDRPPTPEESMRGREIMARSFEEGAAEPKQPVIQQAAELGVIGPEDRPSLAKGSPEDAVNRVKGGGRQPPGGKPPGGNGEPPPGGGHTGSDAWEQRFREFVGKINKPEDIQRIILDSTKDDDFMEARRGDITQADAAGLGEAAGIDPAEIDRRGVGRKLQNDRQVRVAMRIMLEAAENVKEAARNIELQDTPENLIKLQEALMRRNLAVEQIVGFRGEWGRTGNVFQEFLRDVKDQEKLNEFLKTKEGKSPEDLRDIARQVNSLDRSQAAKFLTSQRAQPPGWLWYTWVNSLISGPFTHVKYYLANELFGLSEYGAVTPIAATIGKIKELAGYEGERVYLRETAAVRSFIAGHVDGVLTAASNVRNGVRTPLPAERELYARMVARGEKPPTFLEKNINIMPGRPEGDLRIPFTNIRFGQGTKTHYYTGRVIGAAGDVAMGIHTQFKVQGYRASLYQRAIREAMKEQEADASISMPDRIKHHVENPSDAMMEGAIEDAYKGTYMNELGKHGKEWQRITKTNPILRVLFPFSHIPINIIKRTYEHTPFALLDGDMRADVMGRNGGVAQDKAIARVLLGTGIMSTFAYLTMNDMMTSEWPRDPQEQKRWKQLGIQPNSVRIAGEWVSLNKFGPIGNIAVIGAAIGSAIKHYLHGDEDALMSAAHHGVVAAVNVVKDEVGMLSLAMLYDAIQDEKKGARWIGNQASSLMPYSSFFGQTAAFMDPHARQVKSITDAIKYRIPGARESLPEKLDLFGRPLVNPLYHSVLRITPAAADPVAVEMDRLDYHPTPPQNRVGGVQLTPEIYADYQRRAGTYARTSIEHLMQQPEYGQMPDFAKGQIMRSLVRSAHESARATLQTQHPQIIQQGVDNKVRQINGEKPVKKLELTP